MAWEGRVKDEDEEDAMIKLTAVEGVDQLGLERRSAAVGRYNYVATTVVVTQSTQPADLVRMKGYVELVVAYG